MTEVRENTEETFEDKLARTEGVDQDFASVLVENWQRVLGAFLAVVLGVWVYGEYKNADEIRVGEASKRFALVQESLDKLKTSKDEQTVKLIADNITALKNTYDGTSYSDLSVLYEASALYAEGKYDQAEVKFREISQKPIKSKEFDRAELIKELSGLALARVLIEQEKDSIPVLENLIKTSKVVNVEALIILARISDDQNKIKTLANELKVAKPEFAEQIDREMNSLGVNL